MREKPIRAKVTRRHSDDCWSVSNVVSGGWTTAWLIDDRTPMVFRDTLGRERNGSYAWLQFRCNCPSCPAQMIAMQNDLLEADGVPRA